MTEGKPFNIDLGRLKSREKDRSPQALEKVDRAGEELGFVGRDAQKRRGRRPSPRTGGLMPEGAGSYHKGFNGVSATCTRR